MKRNPTFKEIHEIPSEYLNENLIITTTFNIPFVFSIGRMYEGIIFL